MKVVRTWFVALFLLILTPVTLADFSFSPLLAPDTGAILFGRQDFFGVSSSTGKILDVTVDYAVFGPGTYANFGGIAPLIGSFDPGDYLYAYQVYCNPESTTVLSIFQVNGGGNIRGLGYDLSFDPSGDDKVPSSGLVGTPPSGLYCFWDPQMSANQFSAVLLLSSPNAPGWGPASVIDSGASDFRSLPCPSVPAPAAAILGLIGLSLVGAVKRRLA